MKRLFALASLIAISFAPGLSGTGTAVAADDTNSMASARSTAGAVSMAREIARRLGVSTQATGDLCAIAFLPGPSTSFAITIALVNLRAENLDVAIVDPFDALGGQSLLIESVFGPVAPAGGAITVDYPVLDVANGPAVLEFTDFGFFESAAFSLDPDSYDDPVFGATVADMDATEFNLVYDSDLPGGPRCSGQFIMFSGNKIAFITEN